jgi:hypothetical protein
MIVLRNLFYNSILYFPLSYEREIPRSSEFSAGLKPFSDVDDRKSICALSELDTS